jgi:hypothetical protein
MKSLPAISGLVRLKLLLERFVSAPNLAQEKWIKQLRG